MKNILIVDDHQIITIAMKMLILDNIPNSTVVKARNFESAMQIVRKQGQLDMVILDINIPGGKEDLMISDIRSIRSEIPILILSGYEEREYAARFLQAGANGFVSKTAEDFEIVKAIKAVLNGDKYISSIVKQQIVDSFIDNKKSVNARELLTAREHDVMELLLEGKWTKEIADTLRIKLPTVSAHKSRIFEKYEVDNVIDLFRKVNKTPN